MNFNEQQIKAIKSKEPNIFVISTAGSGKTSTLIGAIKEFKIQNPNSSVAAITFTNKAADELKTRLNDNSVHISTIHSWSLNKLKYLGELYSFRVQLLKEEKIKEILKKLCRDLNYYYINVNQLHFFMMGNQNMDLSAKVKGIFIAVKEAYTNFKRANQLYDFTDLPLYLYDMLIQNNHRITDIDGIFVDEFQDIDQEQSDVFELVDAKKKFLIGDPAQCIYLFRGAIGLHEKTYKNFTTYRLNKNYRSYQEIINYAESFKNRSTNNALPLFGGKCEESDIICDRGRGGQVWLSSWDDVSYPDNYALNMSSKDEEGDVIIKKNMDLIYEFLKDRDTQILCRSNKQVKKFLSLGVINVSTVHQAKGLEYNNVIIVDFDSTNVEEKNIAYVAMTRAKNKMWIIDYNLLYNLFFNVPKNLIQSSTSLF